MTSSHNDTEWVRRYDPERKLFAIRRVNRDEQTGVHFTEYLHGARQVSQEETWQLADSLARLFAEFTGEPARLYFPKFGELHIDGRPNLRLNAKLKKQIRDAAHRLGLDTTQNQEPSGRK